MWLGINLVGRRSISGLADPTDTDSRLGNGARLESQMESAGVSDSLAQLLLAHLDAAYNLARWITRDEHDAQDVVQEAYLRALKYAARFNGTDPKPWLLTIVRNTCFTWLERNRPGDLAPLDERSRSE